MDKICRLCAKTVKKAETLVHISDPNLSIESKLLQCCQIKLIDSVNLPKLCCLNCVNSLKKTYDFVECVLNAQEKFSQKYVLDTEIETELATEILQEIKHEETLKEDPNILGRSSKRKRKSPLKFNKDDNLQPLPRNDEIQNIGLILNNEKLNPQWLSFSISEINNSDKFNVQNVTPIYTETCNEIEEVSCHEDVITNENEINDLNIYHVQNDLDFEEFEINYHEDIEYKPEDEQTDELTDDSDNNLPPETIITKEIEILETNYDENIVDVKDVEFSQDDSERNLKLKFRSDQHFDEISDRNRNGSDRNRNGRINNNGLKKLNINSWNDYPWNCHQCKLQFTHFNKLERHFEDVHKTDEVHYECADCLQVFKTKFQVFLRHVIKRHRHHLKYCCELCGEFYMQPKLLLQHKYTHQIVERPFVCDLCPKNFLTHIALQTHQKVHLPRVNRIRFSCDVCPKKFLTRPNLMTHKRIHSGLREYTCEQCGKSFIQKGNLDNHMLTHVQDRPYSCDFCDKTFKTKLRLTHHASVHSGLKPHQCDSCSRTFREKGTLKEHQRIHTGVMPFKCDFCDKRFRFKGVLTTHRRQHTGERPYSCVECNHHFTNWPNYNKHMKRRHKINTSVTVRKPQAIPPSGMPAQSKLNHIVPVQLAQSNLTINTTTDIIISNDSNDDNQHHLQINESQPESDENIINLHEQNAFTSINNVTVTTQQDAFDDILATSYENRENDNNDNNCDISNIQTINSHLQHTQIIDNNPHLHLESIVKEEYTIGFQQTNGTSTNTTLPTLFAQDTKILAVNEQSMHELHNPQMEMTVLAHPAQQIITHQGQLNPPFNTSIVNYISNGTPVIGFYNIQTVDSVELIHNNSNNNL